MDLHNGSGPQERFRTYAADLASVLGHADRVRPFEDYCVGLLSTEGRKSVRGVALRINLTVDFCLAGLRFGRLQAVA